MKAIEKPWILAAYKIFSEEGPSGLKVEVLSRIVGKNKSSFYHHFADLEVFIEILLDYHLDRAAIIAKQESECKNVVPELLLLILEVKQDLLFNRQLRIHRDNLKFRKCFEQSSNMVAEAIIDIWSEMLGLAGNSQLALMVLKLSLENFYLQITPESLNYDWLLNYMKELQNMVKAFEQNESRKVNSLNGGV